jgi:ATP-dependent Clp protease ATP-binding subunit ClpC
MITPDLLGRFTTHLKDALQKSLQYAVACGRTLVEPGDLLVGLLQEKGSIAGDVLEKSGVSALAAERAFRGISEGTSSRVITPDLSPAVKKIIEKCVLTAHMHEHRYIGTEHLLSAIIESDCTDVHGFLEAHGAPLISLREQVLHVLNSTSRFPSLDASLNSEADGNMPPQHNEPQRGGQQPPRAQRLSALDAFTRELTKPETADTLDPVIGRDNELTRVIEILCRRTKNNPILLGEPGVGKTAIVEGLAKRLAAGDVPDVLHGKKLLSLDLALTVAGTMYRGEFEARLKQILDELKNDPNIILFIDEIHNIVGAGSTSGSLDAANILKPALARGEIRCVGATTWAEFKKHLEPDAALERRFQPISVEEPSIAATLDIINGILPFYAKHHRVTYAPDVVEACVTLAERYITDRFFPDKAIDLLDEAAACVNARRHSHDQMERLSTLELAINAAKEAKIVAVAEGRLEDAASCVAEIEKLSKDYDAFKQTMDDARDKNMPIVSVTDVAEVVSRMAGVPIKTALATERERVSKIESSLTANIFGQDEAMRAVADVVSRARLGLGDPRRPKATMLLVGPSGTGKTETARLLAKELFGREDALVKLDMSEFSEHHTISKLVGSPAGYVGYRDATKLTDKLRKRPHSVVLFDEFEKAHPDVQNILLQILEDGILADGTGKPVTFRHAYVILTSNVGSDRVGMKTLGFGNDALDAQRLTHDELKQRFRPELLNRLDRIITFNPLNNASHKEIVRRELAEILSRVESAQRVACAASDEVLEWLATRPFPAEEGARAARRLVEREVTAIVSKLLAEQPNKKKIRLDVTRAGLKIS